MVVFFKLAWWAYIKAKVQKIGDLKKLHFKIYSDLFSRSFQIFFQNWISFSRRKSMSILNRPKESVLPVHIIFFFSRSFSINSSELNCNKKIIYSSPSSRIFENSSSCVNASQFMLDRYLRYMYLIYNYIFIYLTVYSVPKTFYGMRRMRSWL